MNNIILKSKTKKSMIPINLPDELQHCLDNLNDLSIPTRYPEELQKLLSEYKKDKTLEILNRTKEIIIWIKEKFKN